MSETHIYLISIKDFEEVAIIVNCYGKDKILQLKQISVNPQVDVTKIYNLPTIRSINSLKLKSTNFNHLKKSKKEHHLSRPVNSKLVKISYLSEKLKTTFHIKRIK